MHPSRLAGSRRRLWSGITLLAVAAAALAACSTSTSGAPVRTVTAAPTSSGSASGSPSSSPSSYTGPVSTVHVSSLESDGQTYGVGMPIVLLFSPAPTDSSAFTKAVTVTVNGQPAGGAWFWEQPTADEKKSNSIEAHYRPQHYWQADSSVHVDIPIGGLSAGRGLVYSGKLTSLDIKIGDAHVSTVDGSQGFLDMIVTSNGAVVRTLKVSLGKGATPTYNGVKVVMQKGEDTPGANTLRPSGAVRMVGPGYDEIVSWSVRITRSGEYVHAAPWNSQIGQASTSNGCTNLTTADAQWFYGFAQLGDVVKYSNTGGTTMPSWDGFGDWNVPWGQWAQGGLLLNH